VTPLVRLAQNPVVIGPDFAVEIRIPVLTVNFEDVDPEQAFRGARLAGWPAELAAAVAAHAAGLPVFDEDGDSITWTMRAVRRHLFGRWLAEHGGAAGDVEAER
jgi:hypothetical protein